MRQRSRTRRVLKWVGTVVCLLTLAILTASRWWHVSYVRKGRAIGFAYGLLTTGRVRRIQTGVLVEKIGRPDICWVPVWYDRNISYGFVSLWVPLAALAVPTLVLWWRDRRIPSGFCQHCGYDLTGNVSGTCPECGTSVQPQDS